jgi:hypothetical protein
MSMSLIRRKWLVRFCWALSLTALVGLQANAQEDQSADYPPLDQVTKDFEEVKVQTEELCRAVTYLPVCNLLTFMFIGSSTASDSRSSPKISRFAVQTTNRNHLSSDCSPTP